MDKSAKQLSQFRLNGSFADFIDKAGSYDYLSSSVAIYSAEGERLYCNPAFSSLGDNISITKKNYTPEHSLLNCDAIRRSVDNALLSGMACTQEQPCFLFGNTPISITFVATPLLKSDEDSVTGVILSLAHENLKHENYRLIGDMLKHEELLHRIRQLSTDCRMKDDQVRSLLQSTPFAVIMFDKNRHIVQLNSAGEKMLGIHSRDAMGTKCDSVFDCYQRYRKCPVLDEDVTVDREESLLACPCNEAIPVLRSAVRLGDSDETIVMEAFIDISERKKAESVLCDINAELESRVIERTRELQLAMEEAEGASRAKSEFLSRMSHELRTPMNAILGFSQLLQMDQSLGVEQKENIDEILVAGNHLLGLINEVLDLAKVESGRITLNIQTVALGKLINESIATVRLQAGKRGIEIRAAEVLQRDCHIKSSPASLKVIFINLLSNAVKYNRDGGEVSVSCAPQTEKLLRVSVSDTGPGLTDQQKEEIFEPFNRAGAEESGIEGTGIGMTTALRLVELLGGTLHIESEPGKGSTFSVDLPHDISHLQVNSE